MNDELTQLLRIVAALIALAIIGPVVVVVAVTVAGLTLGDAVWVALIAWAGGWVLQDWKEERDRLAAEEREQG